jgi:Na+/H+-dicarboxylate symporter/ABC-type amino acid transport substrate-binding protein
MTNIFRAFFGMSLSLQMGVATVFGVFIGLFLGEYCEVFGPWGSAYIMILKVTTIPYLICAVIHGIGRLAITTAKDILQKGLIFIGLAWFVNILMIYFAVFLFPQSHGIPSASYSAIQPAQLNFAELLIPDNIFYSLSNNIVPAVVVFGLLVGIALMHVREKEPMMVILETLVDSFTRITAWIARITPIGTFLIIAYQCGTIELSTVKQVSSYLILYIFSVSIIVFWIFPRLTMLLTSIPATRWIRDLFPVLLLAYTTSVVIVTLPFIIELVKREVSNFYRKDTRIQDQIQGMVSIIFNLPLGSLFITVFVFFIACFYHIPFSVGSQFQLFFSTFLTSLGAVGIGSWINSLNFLLDSLGLPLDAIELYLSTVPFTAGFQSMLSVIEIASLSLFVALGCHGLIKIQWLRMLKGLAVIAIPIFLIGSVIKLYNPLPKISNPYISISDVDLPSIVETKIYKPSDPLPSPRGGEPFERILKTKVLRVGYNTNTIPFFFNNNKKHFAGYDAAFAYQLAYDLGCSLEFVPMTFGQIAEEINLGLYDIGMSELSITEKRLKAMYFSDPYLDSRIVFVMRKKFSKDLTSVDYVLQSHGVQVCVLRGTSYESLARDLFPPEQIVLVDDLEDFARYYPHSVLLIGEAQGISWSLNYPNFTVVVPNPLICQESFAYALPSKAERFLAFINLWLKLKKNEGFTQTQYNLWVLGKTKNVDHEEPRWSILRNVFHWVD